MRTHIISIISKVSIPVFLVVIAILFLNSCRVFSEPEEEDFSYYEPVIGEEFNVTVDLTRKVEFEYQKQEDLVIETVSELGYKYIVEIPANATSPGSYNLVDGSSGTFNGFIAPITGIEDLPSDVEFLFGLEIEPYGISFVKPVVITVELPGNFETKNLRGFYNAGWGSWAYLEPVRIEKSTSTTKAIFKVLHFSSYGALSADDSYFDCPDVRSAQTCEDLREVIACNLGHYEIGLNEELNQQDKKRVNNLLRKWMEEQLKYADQEEIDFTDINEFEYELSQFMCWKAMTQEFNADPESVFADLYRQAEDLILIGFREVMSELNEECLEWKNASLSDCSHTGTVIDRTAIYLEWLALAQLLGIEDDPSIIDLFDFCDGSVSNVYKNFQIISPENGLEFEILPETITVPGYYISLNGPNHIISIEYIMTDLLGELVQIDESEIEWIDQGDWGTRVANAIVYNKGKISLNKSNAVVYEMLYSTLDDRPRMVKTNYALFRDSCLMATVSLIWSRY